MVLAFEQNLSPMPCSTHSGLPLAPPLSEISVAGEPELMVRPLE